MLINNFFKKISGFLLCSVMFCSFYIPAFAEDTIDESYKLSAQDHGYSISAYDVDIVVNENGTMNITETIDAYILGPRYGITREFLRTKSLTREDGLTLSSSVNITDVFSEQQFKDLHPSKNDRSRKVKLGSQAHLVTGEQRYKFSYKLDTGNDIFQSCDKMVHNIIDPFWTTTVHNITFSITMPKEFEASNIEFSEDGFLNSENANVSYEINGNTISGRYNSYLNPYHDLKIAVELPNGYFTSRKEAKFSETGFIAICIVLTLISFALWFFLGKDEKPVIGVDFYPPENMSSLAAAYWYKGNLTYDDAICTLLELRNKGYLKIDITDNDSFIISHLKGYDGNDIPTRTMYNGIFEHGKVVTKEQILPFLKNIMYNTISSFRTGKKPPQAYSQSSLFAKAIILTEAIALMYAFIGFSSFSDIFRSNLVFVVFAIPLFIGLAIKIKSEFDKATAKNIKKSNYSTQAIATFKSRAATRFIMSVALFLMLLSIFIAFKDSLLASLFGTFAALEYIIQFVAFILALATIVICFKYVNKRTKESLKNYEKVLSFRNFIETTESERIELLTQEDPDYLKNIQPYVYALDIAEKWAEKTKTVMADVPKFDLEIRQIENTLKQSQALNSQKSNRFGGRTYK